jgi:hypothetical protein
MERADGDEDDEIVDGEVRMEGGGEPGAVT